jgi:hypothetical protein
MSELTLPAALGISEGLRKGRSVRDGHAQGWRLQHGGLREKVLADQLYRQCLALAQERSALGEARRLNLFLLVRSYLPDMPVGDVVQFGAYRCANAIFLAAVCAALLLSGRVHAFDTFAGMPTVDESVDVHNAGDFQDVVALAHIDCDIWSSVAFAYESVRPYMVDGGHIVFDDALAVCCLGALEAVELIIRIRLDEINAEQTYPHLVFRILQGGRRVGNRHTTVDECRFMRDDLCVAPRLGRG